MRVVVDGAPYLKQPGRGIEFRRCTSASHASIKNFDLITRLTGQLVNYLRYLIDSNRESSFFFPSAIAHHHKIIIHDLLIDNITNFVGNLV